MAKAILLFVHDQQPLPVDRNHLFEVFQKNIEQIYIWHYIHVDVCSRFKFATTLY